MSTKQQIAIIGLGYVGLPLCLHFAEAATHVLGFDIDEAKVSKINCGQSYVMHLPSERISAVVGKGLFSASSDFSRVAECQAIIICVPTPLGPNREPNISYICQTAQSIGPHLQKGTLVVLESTTYPGTTERELRQHLEETSGLQAGIDFHLAYSPEREDPGNPQSQLPEIPKVVGGLTPACREKAEALYGQVVRQIVPVSSCRVAEAVKLTENIFRAVNIAMVNELKLVYAAMDIDIWEVITAARTKPFGFMPFYPGPGLGGHCIPIDPFYLVWKARECGKETRFIELAGEVNTAMPSYVFSKVVEALNNATKAVRCSRILLLGIAYKPDVDDDRESPSYVLWKLLDDSGAIVDYHDPHIPEIRPSREHGEFAGRKSVPLTAESIKTYDLVLLSTHHKQVDYELVAKNARSIVDTRNAFGAFDLNPSQYYKA